MWVKDVIDSFSMPVHLRIITRAKDVIYTFIILVHCEDYGVVKGCH